MSFVLKCEYVEEQCDRRSYVMKYPLYAPRTRIDDNAPPEQVLWHRGHTIRLHANQVSVWCAR
jgi:hypothetical protein